MKNKSNIIKALKEVYSKKSYLVLSIIITIFFISLNIMVVNYRAYLNFKDLNVISKIFMGTFSALPTHSVILLIVSSILSGIFISLVVYQMKRTRGLKKDYAAGTGGVLLGMLAPSCAACGIGLAAILGFAGVIGSLPFDGIEISALGIILLTFAIFHISNKIVKKTC